MSDYQTSFGKVFKTPYALQHIDQHASGVKRMKNIVFASMACILVSACSVSSVTQSVTEESKLVNASVTKPVEQEGVATQDAELIKSVVADAGTGISPSALAWSNPQTGSRGTITAIDRFTGSHGQKCKKFQTTVDTFMGISLYNGETCELRKGFWVLSWFLREES